MISQRLIELRKSKNLNKKELTDTLGFNYSTYSNYELGYRPPDAQTIRALSDFYNVSSDYILGISDSREIKNEPEKGSEQWLLYKILQAVEKKGIKKLDNETVNKILKTVQANTENNIDSLIDILGEDTKN